MRTNTTYYGSKVPGTSNTCYDKENDEHIDAPLTMATSACVHAIRPKYIHTR